MTLTMEWISIKDQLPEPNKIVLIWNEESLLEYQYHVGFHRDGQEWVTTRDNYPLDYATHWMPLPERPKQ
jgi:hypothetical protein